MIRFFIVNSNLTSIIILYITKTNTKVKVSTQIGFLIDSMIG